MLSGPQNGNVVFFGDRTMDFSVPSIAFLGQNLETGIKQCIQMAVVLYGVSWPVFVVMICRCQNAFVVNRESQLS